MNNNRIPLITPTFPQTINSGKNINNNYLKAAEQPKIGRIWLGDNIWKEEVELDGFPVFTAFA